MRIFRCRFPHQCFNIRRNRYHLMKRTIFFFFIFHIFSTCAHAQDKDLKLILVSEYKPDDSTFGYKIRIDFISQKSSPIKFIYNPLFSIHCCPDIKESIGVEIEKFDSNQYRPFTNCADCDPSCCELPKLISKTLNKNDTISYHDEIYLSKRIIQRKDKPSSKIFIGRYRCRAWRIYKDDGREYKIYSDWLYIEFPRDV